MNEVTSIFLLVISTTLHSVTCMFYHEPSAVLLKPGGEPNPRSDFGFAMGHWNRQLIVGSPSNNFFGEVYSCPVALTSNDKNITCSYIDLNATSTEYSLEINPNQKFYLGATISTTKDYFFTCAPLVTKSIRRPRELKIHKDAFGSCFVHLNNGSSYQYKGPDHRFLEGHDNKLARIEGGTGWNTLADEANGFLITAKTSVVGDINYSSISDPWVEPTSLASYYKKKTDIFRGSTNIGYGLIAAKFFLNQPVVYAFSMQSAQMNGEIIFLKPKGNHLTLLQKEQREMYKISNRVVGAMFGYALNAADLNLDGLSELLVGAPAQADDEDDLEYGALHIYLGGDIKEFFNDKSRMRTIFGAKERGRFGTAIAASDVDKDNIPEIIVSAPYEDTGVVYILSGYYLSKELIKSTSFKQIQVSQLQCTQRVRRSDMTLLGFSLQVVPDVDGNGCDDLAIGAPGAASVFLLRCLQTINVTVTSQLIGSQNVREKDSNFSVNVCLQIDYISKSTNVSGRISVNNDIHGGAAYFLKPSFTVDLSEKPTSHCENLTVILADYKTADYTVSTHLELVYINRSLESKDFDQSWVVLSPYSVTKRKLYVVRRCSGDDCNPQLTMEIRWNGTTPYELGSSEMETVHVVVKNDGHEAYGACVWFEVTGARVYNSTKCQPKSKCLLPSPLKLTAEHTIKLFIVMTKLSNMEEALRVTARLYENCNLDKYTNKTLEIPYSFHREMELVYLDGDSLGLEITDKEIFDTNIESFRDARKYVITNNGSITWKNINAVILMEKQPFMKTVGTSEDDNCKIFDEVSQNQFKINCYLTLPVGITEKVIWAEISKKDVDVYLKEKQQLNVSSKMILYVVSDGVAKEKELISTIKFKKDMSFKNNRLLIILVAVILALLVLALITYILYKNNFFKRKEKKKLDVLRESVRRRSIRLASESKHSQKTTSAADDDHGFVNMEVGSDSAFEETTVGSKDDVLHVQLQADVHSKITNEQTSK